MTVSYRPTFATPEGPLMVVLGLALAARLAALCLMPEIEMPDTADYLLDGAQLFETGQVFTYKYMPLYSILAHLSGGGLGLKLADILLSTATVGLTYRLAERLFDNCAAAFLAGLAAAVYPHFIFYSISRLSETLYLFLTCWAFLALYDRRAFWGSVLLVLSILTRPTVDMLAPVLIIAFSIVIWREPARRAAFRLATYAVVYVVIMTPWWLHNYEKYGTFVRLNLGDGLVLYSGNNPMNRTGGGVATGSDADDMDVTPFKQITDVVERNEAYKQAAFDFIRENPGRFIELAGLKFVRFWRLWPFATSYQTPLIIIASLLSYGVVLALSILFLFTASRQRLLPVSPFLLFAAYLTLVHMISIGSIRYRLPLEPFMIVLAAATAAPYLQRVPVVGNLLTSLSHAND